MKCHEIRAKLPAYLDRTLSPTERSIVHVHLKQCHECQKVLQSYTSAQSKDLQKDESIKSINKTGFRPQKSKTKHQDVQTKLQAAGLIAPTPNERIQTTVRENSGEELLRKHMLAMLSEEEEKLKESETEVEPLDMEEVPILSEQEEPDFQWTREMSLEAAMSGGVVDDEEEADIEKVTLPITPLLPLISNWQDDPEQYIEIPYTHPVTRSEVLKKVRRNSMEGILFLENETEKNREAKFLQEEPTIPFETLDNKESILLIQSPKMENQERTAAEIARSRLYQQFSEAGTPQELSIKPRTINQTSKTLPFHENTKKQAVLYRFFTVILLLLLSLITFFLWQNESIPMNGIIL